MMRLGIATLALIGLAACAGAPTASAPPAAATVPISPDQAFLDRAATGTGNEVQLGRLAQQRGYAASVRAFGAHLAAEHSRAYAGVMALAQRLNLMPAATAGNFGALAALSGPEFDRQFIIDQIKNQRDALSLFDSASQVAQDPRVRRFARDWIAPLRRDLGRAENVAAGVGALALR